MKEINLDSRYSNRFRHRNFGDQVEFYKSKIVGIRYIDVYFEIFKDVLLEGEKEKCTIGMPNFTSVHRTVGLKSDLCDNVKKAIKLIDNEYIIDTHFGMLEKDRELLEKTNEELASLNIDNIEMLLLVFYFRKLANEAKNKQLSQNVRNVVDSVELVIINHEQESHNYPAKK